MCCPSHFQRYLGVPINGTTGALTPVPGSPFPHWPSKIRENHLVPAGIAAGIGRVGWHTFRHTYSSLLREHEVDIKVQQALLRHADIRTTMNIYTQAVPRAVREANRKVVLKVTTVSGMLELRMGLCNQ